MPRAAPLPPTSLVWKAIDVYLSIAYGPRPVPSAVRQRIETLRACPDDKGFYDCPVLELDDKLAPTRYGLRLGNAFYPHMKLVIERSPDGRGFLFRADTHDRHVRPAPESREYKAFCELMQLNQTSAEAIEAEWTRRGIPTFKQYLRDDLARRSSSDPAASAGGVVATPLTSAVSSAAPSPPSGNS
jgi:hypothetical protein